MKDWNSQTKTDTIGSYHLHYLHNIHFFFAQQVIIVQVKRITGVKS